MATLTVRNIDDDLKAKLRIQAARHGRSMEAEARALIEEGVRDRRGGEIPAGASGAELFARIFKWDEGDDDENFDLLDYIPPREPMRDPPTFD